jgi:hypothetical protein
MTYIAKKGQRQRKTSTLKKTEMLPKEAEIVDQKLQEPKVRYLKVQPHFREKRVDFIKREIREVPQLRLCGDWLQAAGFSPEEYVSVTVMPDLLIIRSSKIKEENKTFGLKLID